MCIDLAQGETVVEAQVISMEDAKMPRSIAHTASAKLTSSRPHLHPAQSAVNPAADATFLYEVLFGLIAAMSVSGAIAAYLATSSIQ